MNNQTYIFVVDFQMLEWVKCDEDIADICLWIFIKMKELESEKQEK